MNLSLEHLSLEAEQHFSTFKGVGFVACFVVATLIQVLIPYRRHISSDFRNWRINLPLASVNVLVLTIVCGACVCAWSMILDKHRWGLFNVITVPLLVQILMTILVLDFIAYIWHRANHRWKLLWRFHAVHHSDVNFDTSTAVRFHTGELIISLGIRLLIVSLFGLPAIGILEFLLVYQFFNIVEHGNIRLPLKLESFLSPIVVTPALHRKHHSVVRADLNSNFGTIFSFWDRIGSTFHSSSSDEKITIGLPGKKGNITMLEALLLPLGKFDWWSKPSKNEMT